MTQFKAEVFQNAFLPEGAREVHAIMTVSVEGGDGINVGPSGGKLIGIVCDHSGSMQGGKIHAAKEAMIRIVGMLPEDTYFFVVAGAEEGTLVVPTLKATPESKLRAVASIKQIQAEGGTCISTWLAKALNQFAAMPNAIRQGLLLTAGDVWMRSCRRATESFNASAGA